MTSTQDNTHPSEYALHRWLSTERPQGEISSHINGCSTCQKRVSDLTAAKDAFLIRHPATDLLEAIEEKTKQSPSHQSFWTWLLRWAPLQAPRWAMAMVILVVMGGAIAGGSFLHPFLVGIRDAIRYKGTHINWVVRRHGQQIRVGASFTYRDGDRLGIQVTASKKCYVTLVIVDSKGGLTQWLPKPTEPPLVIFAGRKTTLPESILMERPIVKQGLYLLLTKAPVDVNSLQKRLYHKLNQTSDGVIRKAIKLPIEGYQESRWVNIP